MPIKVTIDGKSWLTEDLTLDECVSIEREDESTWLELLTAPTKTADRARAIIKRFLAREYGDEEGAKRAGVLTLRQVADAFTTVEEDDRPDMYEDGVPVVDPKAGEVEPTTTSLS